MPTSNGGTFWHSKVIRAYLLDDVYKPHTQDEITAFVEAGQMTSTVAAALDPNKTYGIWWYNRRRTRRTQVSEPRPNGERSYKKKSHYVYRPQEEWVAVPVPGSGVPREWVDAAREAVKENGTTSRAGYRVWEVSGGIAKCASCGYNMLIHSVSDSRTKGRLFYYRCRTRNRDGARACPHSKCHRAEQLESQLWDLVAGLLEEP